MTSVLRERLLGPQGAQGRQGAQGWQGPGGADLYTNPDPTPITVGGIPAGSSFLNDTMTEMWDALLYPELFPALTPPSNAFALAQAGLHEIAEVVAALNFTATFSRGLINPAYGTSGFRSGLPNTYNYTGAGLPAGAPSVLLADIEAVLVYTVLVGAQSWTNTVSYDIGEQPLSSEGNNFGAPLPPGTTGVQTVTITGVYPYFATTVNILTLTKQPLALMTSAFVQTNMVMEDALGNKQSAEFPVAWSPITGIQFYNTVSGLWEWIQGTKANSLTTFTQSPTIEVIQGNNVNYTLFTNNTVKIGARMLRWWTT